MKPSRGKVRISASAVLGAVAFAMLACAGCFDTGAPAAPAPWQPSPQLEAAGKADEDAVAAYKQASLDMLKVCAPVKPRSINDCAKVCLLFDPGGENTKKEALEKLAREEKKARAIAAAPVPTYKEIVDSYLSPLCVQEHLKECGVVEIMQSKSLDDNAKAHAEIKLLAQIDPACGAALAFQAEKDQEMSDTLDRVGREVNRENELDTERLSPTPYPVNTSCSATPGGGFNCYSY
jgi:hypothetical protein